MKNNKLLFFILLLLAAAGCSKDNNDNGDSYETFVGQWQEIARGNEGFPELPPSSRVIEFFDDNTTTYYGTLISTYRTDAEFLYLNSGKDPDGHTYQYAFSSSDNLRLDYVDGNIEDSALTPTFHIYKRLK
ncbi:MAG: hypothetical protein LBJ58_01415 [Tannerellaceae bacterium]|jgi:hypothetical protein|nr:hypothetical protein [Tannerellaceae bacterium]